MVPELNEEQKKLQEGAIALARGKLGRNMIERDREETFDREGWKACAEFGENQQGGVWSSSGCPPSDLGACRFGFSVGVDVVSYFYAGGGLTSELARQACEDINQIDEDGDLDLMSTWCEG